MLVQDKRQGQPHNHLLNTVLEYINHHYMKDITINDIATQVNISPQYLCRLFKQELHVRPFEYIQQLRINNSKSLLLMIPSLKIEDVSKAMGFQSPGYYSAIFKKHEKITPRDFIKLHQRGV
jgi:YesN/AraC family two-component response regulator